MRYESVRKPKKCPKCGSKKVARILYGMPIYSEKLMNDIEEGKIVLGGCCISPDNPHWQCADCETELYHKFESFN